MYSYKLVRIVSNIASEEKRTGYIATRSAFRRDVMSTAAKSKRSEYLYNS